jgi:(1->4)-alpha-D-glucan 1-alpha-D-glucosylmutase
LDAAAAAVPYLADLGVTHLYLSPVLQAMPGSAHGYDVADPTALSADLGGPEAFERLSVAAHARGLGIVLDIVPHHLAVGRANPWWWDVLRFGRRAHFAGVFDIDWDAPEERLRDRVILPVLDDHYGRVLDAGRISLQPDADDLVVVAIDDWVAAPLSPGACGTLVEELADRAGDAVLGMVGRVLARLDDPDVGRETRYDDWSAARTAVEARLDDVAEARAAWREVLTDASADPDRLHALLERQPYRLSRWQSAAHELGYRRFFDVSSLVALRSERPEVFAATHQLALRLLAEGQIDGLRVDHVDGLADPAGYVQRLRDAAGESAWIVLEKILGPYERLPPAWDVDGTTGYDLASLLTPLLVDPTGQEELESAWRAFTGESRTWEEHQHEARSQVLEDVLGSDVSRLTELLVRVCEERREDRDFTRAELRDALVALCVAIPVYRTYGRRGEDGWELSPEDAAVLSASVDRARVACPDLDGGLFVLLQRLLTAPATPLEEELARRVQQLTGPAVAKGDEDTALYRYTPLLALCEVGHHPDRFSVEPGALHSWCAEAVAQHPATMTTTSTHDTKRSEDVRARLAVLAEDPAWWRRTVDELHDLTAAHRGPLVDPGAEWLAYQTLVGAWPIDVDRLWPVVEKSVREAKRATSWLRPDSAYEAELRAWLDRSLADDAVGKALERAAARIRRAGWANALAQVALRLTCPGVPDTYQGCEVWDLSLVDPDNRRPVDLAALHDRLRALDGSTPADCWEADPDSGDAKLAMLRDLLALRRRHPGAFPGGPYAPLPVTGPEPLGAVAFTRGEHVAVIVPRFPLRGASRHDDTTVTLPTGRWTDAMTGAAFDGGPLTVTAACRAFPVAVLEQS